MRAKRMSWDGTHIIPGLISSDSRTPGVVRGYPTWKIWGVFCFGVALLLHIIPLWITEHISRRPPKGSHGTTSNTELPEAATTPVRTHNLWCSPSAVTHCYYVGGTFKSNQVTAPLQKGQPHTHLPSYKFETPVMRAVPTATCTAQQSELQEDFWVFF